MNELQECHTLVWAFRKEMSEYWPTPDPLDSLRWAFCEAGEAMDCFLQSKKIYKRNNPENKHENILDELADCAIMLLTAVPVFQWEYFEDKSYPLMSLDELAINISDLFRVTPKSRYFRDSAMIIISEISNYPEMNLLERIKSRLARISFKHMPFDRSAELIKKLDLPSSNLPYKSYNHPLVESE